jgi:integrase
MDSDAPPRQFDISDIAAAKPGTKTLVWDTRGLYLYFDRPTWKHPQGLKRWMFRYRRPSNSRPTEIKIGHLRNVTLEQARAAAQVHNYHLDVHGKDPQEIKRISRGQRMTFEATAEEFLKAPANAHWSASQIRNVRNLLFDHGKPLLREAVATITQHMVKAAIEDLFAKHFDQAKRALKLWERVFDLALYEGYRTQEWGNPARWKGMHETPFGRRKVESKNFEAKPYEQVPTFFHALSQLDDIRARALQFLILNGTRTGETLGARWSEIKDGVWTIPEERMKAGTEHRVPLSPQAMAILEQLDKDSFYVFPGRSFSARGQNPLSQKTLLRLMRSMGETADVHGFRTSFAVWAQEQADARLETIDACLAHKIKEKVTRAYARSDVFERRRELMNRWGQFIDSAKTKQPIQNLLKLVATD